MKLNKSLILNIALALLVASAIGLFSRQGSLKRLELESVDFSFRLRGPLRYNPHIVIIEVTDSDIASVGRWPWKRTWYAAMVKALSGLGAKAIYFDVILSEPSTEEDDDLLAEALKQAQNVYLPFAFEEANNYDTKNAILPLAKFSPDLKGTGSININPDVDGVFRMLPLLFPLPKGAAPHVVLKLSLDYAGLKIESVKPGELLLSDAHKKISIPLNKNNEMFINWAGRWQDTFRHYAYLEVLSAYKDFLDNKKPAIDLSDFKDSICLVSVTAIGLYDIKPVPLQPQYPGIGIVATAISNILEKNFLSQPPDWINALILYILVLIPAFFIAGKKPLKETFIVFLAGVIYFSISLIFFKKGVALNTFEPLFGLLTSSLTIGTYNFVRVAVERQSFFKMAVTDGLTGLVNIRYFKALLESELRMAKVDPGKKFCLIMGDIDHFKYFNDTYGHQAGDLVLKEVSAILKGLVRTSDIVARYGGEEIIILLRGTPLEGGLAIAEKMRKNIAEYSIRDKANAYKVTVSLGVSAFKLKDNVESIIKRADEGLYQAKNAGRNRVETKES